jgi:predicted DNA-binding transcriptional regulator YafY
VDAVGQAGSYQRPAHVDLLDHVAGRAPDEVRVAHVRVRGNRAGRLRRMAREERDGVLTVTFTDLAVLARAIASAGVAATAIDPPELIDAVVARLSAAAGAP